jgi:RNA polymerase sigma-70 factor (ECF subfamily)
MSMEPWIAAARSGEKDALDRLLGAWWPFLLKLANQELDPVLRARMAPSDVALDTLTEAQRDFHRFEGHTDKAVLAWLEKICRNNLANARKFHLAAKRSVIRDVPHAEGLQQLAAEGPATTPSGEVQAREEAQRLEAALRLLSEQDRAVIELHNREQLTFEQVGARLGCSAEAARKRWARALVQLQAMLGADHVARAT